MRGRRSKRYGPREQVSGHIRPPLYHLGEDSVKALRRDDVVGRPRQTRSACQMKELIAVDGAGIIGGCQSNANLNCRVRPRPRALLRATRLYNLTRFRGRIIRQPRSAVSFEEPAQISTILEGSDQN